MIEHKTKLRKHKLGFLQIEPLPSEEKLNKYYTDTYFQKTKSATYQSSYSGEEMEYINHKIDQKIKIIVEQYNIKKGNLLDLGCGEGFVLKNFQKRGWDVFGTDFSDFGIAKFHPDLLQDFSKGDIHEIINELIIKQRVYDVIWLGNVLEHILEPIALLKSLHQLLKPNGSLVITVPNDGSEYQSMLLEKEYVDKKWWIAYPDHLSYFDYDSLINISEYTGYGHYKLISDFPIDFFLMHSGSNYVSDQSLGKEAHKARVLLENFIATHDEVVINDFYSSLAKIGLGRNLIVFLSPEKGTKDE